MKRKVTIVVPVYSDWPSLSECIISLNKHVDTKRHKIMLVNDCGPEADFIERNIKATIANQPNFHYEHNPKNLGFVGTCNRAVSELDTTDNDILLLNSDTKVTEGFLDEMIAVIYSQDNIGAVSPRSNNATLATIPIDAASRKGINPHKSYKMFLKLKNILPQKTIIPVAHGFCILISRDLIKRYGLFDTIFGKGYGEEVDFCQRIKKHGFKCALANHAFVFHLEARSFSLETKAKLLEKNNKIIWQRYPNYRNEVREYMEIAVQVEGEAARKVGIKVRSRIKHQLKQNSILSKIAHKIRD